MDYSPPPVVGSGTRGLRLWYPFPLRWYERLPLVLVGLMLVIPLGIAMRLTPSPSGLGTHHQLGLPPCTMRQLFGIRCPSCGMTTSWAHMVRGQVLSAVKANAGGTLLALAALFAGPWMLICGLKGNWLLRPPNEWVVLGFGITLLAVTMIDWIIRLTWQL